MMQYEETGRVVTRARILSASYLNNLELDINDFIKDKTGVEIQLIPEDNNDVHVALITYREYVEN